ncbi:MAG: M1 family metallopeptidase, partial [Fidelibacterota bacterium]
ASQWVVTSKIVDGVQFYTYFFEEDSSLASEYLEMSIEYVKMYSDMLSPYPFTKFAVVENFFPTGYGMPSYTVLGRSVVRLPFIVYTSLGHEVLHNWWGNSVYVGDGGNWCEGLTTYQADYLYKMQSSESAARQYRKDILKDYTVYVNDKNDFPPSEFVSRWDDASRAIGYGKVAMIFHMLEQQLGTDAFITALQSVIANFQFKKATWDDFIAAFESAGNTDLSDFKTQWIESAGAPELRIMEKRDGLVLEQSKEVRPITVDVTSIDNSGVQTSSTLTSNSSETNIPIKFDDQLAEVRIDKDFHVMRRLHPQEMDPTIRETLSKDDYVFIVPEMTPEWKEIARSYHGYLSDSQTLDIRANVSDIEEGKTPIYLGILPKPLNYLRSNGEINVYGNSIDADTHSLVWAFKDKDDEPGLVIYSGEARELIPVARKLPHYGKYGYLVFSQGENRKKGYHQTLESPLVWRK